jgi:hypothetical protein
MSKKRGGQPDNKNAYKHGFYSKYFSAFERKALSDLPSIDVTNEIGLLRVQIDRFMQAYTGSLEELDYEERLAALRTVTLAVGRIASLERIRSSAGKNLDQYNEFMQMLAQLDELPADELDCDPL